MTEDRKLIFSYGLDLDLDLLHSCIGGPKPICWGPGKLRGFRRRFNACGRLPNLEAMPGATVEGALTSVTADQFGRVLAWLLVPMVYRPHGAAIERPGPGRNRRATVFRAATDLPDCLPSHSELRAMLRGARDRGLQHALADLEAVQRRMPAEPLLPPRWALEVMS